MKLKSFFKLVNKKIKKYDKATSTNPFMKTPLSITLVWIEDEKIYASQEKYEDC